MFAYLELHAVNFRNELIMVYGVLHAECLVDADVDQSSSRGASETDNLLVLF